MVIYDTQKSNYGMNPLKAYRLSEKAITCFSEKADLAKASKSGQINLDKIAPHMVQTKINKEQLSVQELFEEIPLKLHRSHMQ